MYKNNFAPRRPSTDWKVSFSFGSKTISHSTGSWVWRWRCMFGESPLEPRHEQQENRYPVWTVELWLSIERDLPNKTPNNNCSQAQQTSSRGVFCMPNDKEQASKRTDTSSLHQKAMAYGFGGVWWCVCYRYINQLANSVNCEHSATHIHIALNPRDHV